MKIYIPVHFYRIMNNIQNQLSIKKNFMVDITPFEVYELVESLLLFTRKK